MVTSGAQLDLCPSRFVTPKCRGWAPMGQPSEVPSTPGGGCTAEIRLHECLRKILTQFFLVHVFCDNQVLKQSGTVTVSWTQAPIGPVCMCTASKALHFIIAAAPSH